MQIKCCILLLNLPLLEEQQERAGPNSKCIFALLTDGHDNRSKQFTASQLSSYMKELEGQGKLVTFFLASCERAPAIFCAASHAAHCALRMLAWSSHRAW